ncbi:hypothetical protein L873DRAFT_1791537 [Choiromyces venosus 120613-1]|uniref:Uncharacterized protein n=1 Tax=Choiromyces venosus 120613-1 TaxID=1336337 RepID=A0A3N4JE42_9PEZI|nr:hypothetical protein L873DRAFT_1791537 [Choiromyces venosus 120613-1]
MSNPRRSKNKFIVPLAVTAVAAVASLGLYLWLGPPNRSSTTPGTNARNQPADEEEDDGSPPKPLTFTPSGRKAVVVIDGNRSSPLLQPLKNRLSVPGWNVFVLVLGDAGVDEDVRTEIGGGVEEFVLRFEKAQALAPMLKQLGPEIVFAEEGLVAGVGGIIGNLLDGGWVGGIVVCREAGGDWETGVRRYGKRCKVVDKEGLRAEWGARIR